MEKQTHTDRSDRGTLEENARDLMAATADIAGEKVAEARKRLAAALESGKELYGQVSDRAVEKARVVDETLRAHPYQAIGMAFGVGFLIGVLGSGKRSRSERG